MKTVGRLLLLAGALGLALSVLLPWVTVKGPALDLDLGVVGAKVSSGSKTVAGLDTSLWPGVVALAAIVAAVTLLGLTTRLLVIPGIIAAVAGAGLAYYCSNVLDIETSGNALKRAVSDAILTSSLGPGPSLMLASGVAIIAGSQLSS